MMNSKFDIYKFQAGGVLPTQENLTFRGANIDFGDYISPDTRLIASNAAYAQQVANKRLADLMEERQKIIDVVKLDKRFAQLQGQLTGQLDSLVEQAAQSQLSDNANFTKFNTGLIKVKSDPAIQNALKSTEYAKAYADWRIKNPNAVDKDYLNGGNEREFQRFQNGETDEFVMRPTYVEPNWQEDLFKKAKDIPDEEKEIFRNLGSAVYQEKTKGKTAEEIKSRMNNHINYLLTSDPKTAPHFQRMKKFGYDPLPEIQNVINSAADQYKNESVTLSNMQANPNVLTPYQQRSLAVQEKNAETSRMNALNRMADEGSAGKVRFEYLTGIGSNADQLNIWKGTTKYNDSWKDDIINSIKAKNTKTKSEDIKEIYDNITKDDIVIVGIEKNTGKVQYKFKPGTEGVDVNKTYEEPVQGLQAIIAAETPVKSPVITQEEFNNKWKTLEPGQSLTGPDGTTYTKVKK